jgi:predicted DNA-binding WGR domain protein
MGLFRERRFESATPRGGKFWTISIHDTSAGYSAVLHFGVLGSKGLYQTHRFKTKALMAAFERKMIKQKLGRGYTEVTDIDADTEAIAAITPTNGSPTAIKSRFQQAIKDLKQVLSAGIKGELVITLMTDNDFVQEKVTL